ncbi:MAG: ArsR/SmtB family transcription factor [Candidatus Hodarchaeales archaeon]|jgi:DNA-binding transcriptional ArsR family regulator
MEEKQHADFCCPIDPQRNKEWTDRLEREKERLITLKGEKQAEHQLILKVISNPLRLEILNYLHQKPNCVCELVRKLGAKNSTVSYHLSYLAKFSLIQDKMTGGNVIYYRTRYGKAVLNWLEKMPIE